MLAGGDRVAIYDLERDDGTAIDVHSKSCIVDDVWASVGSDNLNTRSWSHDSAISCAIIDETRDDSELRDPCGRGEGARVFARDLRVRLSCEHTAAPADAGSMIDPHEWFATLDRRAAALGSWHREDRDRQQRALADISECTGSNALTPYGMACCTGCTPTSSTPTEGPGPQAPLDVLIPSDSQPSDTDASENEGEREEGGS